MERISREELRKLSAICARRRFDNVEILQSSEATNLERALAEREIAYMEYLIAKLDRIADSDARRVEIARR